MAQRNKDRAKKGMNFFIFILKSPVLSSFGKCQAFLVLCPPICSSGLQRGQRSGWGGQCLLNDKFGYSGMEK